MKSLDMDQLNRLIYTERPPCPQALTKALQDTFNRCLQGTPYHQTAISICLTYAINPHTDSETTRKMFYIACTGRLPLTET